MKNTFSSPVWHGATLILLFGSWSAAGEPAAGPIDQQAVLKGLRDFYAKTARPDGSFQPGIDPEYRGMSDSAYSDLAAITYACTIHRTFGWRLPDEQKTMEFLLSRQKPSGEFVNVAGTVDPLSPQGRVYNTTQALVALKSLGVKPRHDPLPVFEEILKQDYKTLPAYSTSFFPLAYLCYGKPIPEQADRAIRALMIQDEDGYLNNHVAATFHASHYYRLVGEVTPKSRQMVARVLRDQGADGSWLLNMPSRDRHATFDAVFTLRHEGAQRQDCQAAIERAAQWALSCRNADGGFGHFPGSSSDADAVYFQVGTLVMAGFLRPVDPLPPDPHLLSWGHLMPVRERTDDEPLRLELPGWVGSVAISPDARLIASGSSDRMARLWDARQGTLAATLEGHTNCVVSVVFAPDGQSLATGSFDGTAKIWDTEPAKIRHTLQGHVGGVTSVAYAPGGSLLATAGIDGTIRLWDTKTGQHQRTLAGHKSWVNSIVFHPDSQRLFSGSSDGTVRVWSVPAGEPLGTLEATKAEVRSVALSPDGTHLAAAMRYGVVKVWTINGWKEVADCSVPADDAWSVAFSSDSRRLFSTAGEWNRSTVIVGWNLATSKRVAEFKHPGEVLSIAVSKDGRVLVAGGADQTVSVWKTGAADR
ncbi:MAG TPA: prenyltransferase/squalene oxidase repeat-containing protein [Pirellulaceae bacterium]|nr:prenyltransferase/squalene oxidase repeat-containing protein [Pirellulaceae bacterium]